MLHLLLESKVNIQTEILQKAAKHHLDIQFHGAYKPTGLCRTYPNEFTREGAMGYEYNKWDKKVTPETDLNIVFTRLLAGSTDYHLGGFRAVPPEKYEISNLRPVVMGTRCHMLALYVVLENALPMVADYPEAYNGQPGFEIIKQIPAAWDQTVVPMAVIDQYAVVARKKNDVWFVGAINSLQEREVVIPLSFLDEGNYMLQLYADADDVAANPNHLSKKVTEVSGKSQVKVKLASGGGAVMVIKKS